LSRIWTGVQLPSAPHIKNNIMRGSKYPYFKQKNNHMQDVVFKVYQVFYTKPAKKRRKALSIMLKWCFKEYIKTFKKEEIPLNVMTNEIVKLDD